LNIEDDFIVSGLQTSKMSYSQASWAATKVTAKHEQRKPKQLERKDSSVVQENVDDDEAE
jgi:hypothetical protein